MSAKKTVRAVLGEFGWPEEAMADLGGIRAARATETYVPMRRSKLAFWRGSRSDRSRTLVIATRSAPADVPIRALTVQERPSREARPGN